MKTDLSLHGLAESASRQFSRLAPLADLAARLWVAAVFFKSGLVKIQPKNRS